MKSRTAAVTTVNTGRGYVEVTLRLAVTEDELARLLEKARNGGRDAVEEVASLLQSDVSP